MSLRAERGNLPMDADSQPTTGYRLPTTAIHPQIMSLRAERGNLPIYADSQPTTGY
jgi:hypothetical protein